jgi:hypothetical protein
VRPEVAIEFELLRAMQSFEPLGQNAVKCDRVLRRALQSFGKHTDAAEYALCNAGNEDAEVKRFYDVLRRLVECRFAEGAGDLRSPAGPRYTECRITATGTKWLNELLQPSPKKS